MVCCDCLKKRIGCSVCLSACLSVCVNYCCCTYRSSKNVFSQDHDSPAVDYKDKRCYFYVCMIRNAKKNVLFSSQIDTDLHAAAEP